MQSTTSIACYQGFNTASPNFLNPPNKPNSKGFRLLDHRQQRVKTGRHIFFFVLDQAAQHLLTQLARMVTAGQTLELLLFHGCNRNRHGEQKELQIHALAARPIAKPISYRKKLPQSKKTATGSSSPKEFVYNGSPTALLFTRGRRSYSATLAPRLAQLLRLPS